MPSTDDRRRLDRRADACSASGACRRCGGRARRRGRPSRGRRGRRPRPPATRPCFPYGGRAARARVAVAHRERPNAARGRCDVRDAVDDDRRELDQRRRGRAPDDPERRPHVDLVVRLRPAGVGAVHRPLQLRLVDADADLGPVAELEALLEPVVAALDDLDLQARVAGDPDLRDALRVGAAGEAADLDARLARPARPCRRRRRSRAPSSASAVARASACRRRLQRRGRRLRWSSAPPACPRNSRRRAARARTVGRPGAPAPG